MAWDNRVKELYPQFDCEGPLGFPMASAQAKELETLIAEHAGDSLYEYRHGTIGKAAYELIEGERADISVITSETIDRDREVVVAKGIDLTQFKKYPLVTFMHCYYELPIGKCLWIKRDGDSVKAKTRYSSKPEGWEGNWLSDAIWHLIKEGDMKGKSIGFLPRKGHVPTPEEIKKNPNLADANWIWDETILFEYAVCTVQCNPDAVVEAVAKGIVNESLAKLFEIKIPPAKDDDPPPPKTDDLPIAGKDDDDETPLEKTVTIDADELARLKVLAAKGIDAELKQAKSPPEPTPAPSLAGVGLHDFRKAIASAALSEVLNLKAGEIANDAIDRLRGRV